MRCPGTHELNTIRNPAPSKPQATHTRHTTTRHHGEMIKSTENNRARTQLQTLRSSVVLRRVAPPREASLGTSNFTSCGTLRGVSATRRAPPSGRASLTPGSQGPPAAPILGGPPGGAAHRPEERAAIGHGHLSHCSRFKKSFLRCVALAWPRAY